MHNVFLIARREYLERIRTKSFLVMTVLIPILMAGGIFGSVLLTGRTKSASHIAVVSDNQQLATDLQHELTSGKDPKLTVDVISPAEADTRSTLDGELADKRLDGYVWIASGDSANGRPAFSYTPRSTDDFATRGAVDSAVRTVLMRERLTHQGIGTTDIDGLTNPLKVDTTQAGKASDSVSAYAGAIVLFMLMYFVIMLYGMNVARSIIEEKTSRVFEVLLAMIRPEEMMAGKMIGVGSVGLTQIAIWMAAALILTSASLVGSHLGSDLHFAISGVQVAFFALYFILGYLLYSSIAAALGAMTNSEQELQQLNMLLVMPLAGCMFALGVVVTNPNGTIATVLSLIPFCSPLIMYMRITLSMPPAWQIALSIVLMALTIYAILWVASRIYRVGVLMYGKRPNLPEIMRWLKYS